MTKGKVHILKKMLPAMWLAVHHIEYLFIVKQLFEGVKIKFIVFQYLS